MESTNNIYIKTFGNFDIFLDNKSVFSKISRSYKTLKLLKYLIVNREKGILPELIVEKTWPETKYSDPRNVLRTQIFRMKRILENTGLSDHIYVEFFLGCYVLRLKNSTVDVDMLENLSREISGASLDDENAQNFIDELFYIYKGEFMGDINTEDDWILPFRNQYRRLFIKSLKIIMDFYIVSVKNEKILELCEKAIAVEPQEEKLQIDYINALILNKRKNEAFDYCRFITSRIYKDTNTKISKEMQDLYKKLLQNIDENMTIDLDNIDDSILMDEEYKGAFFCDKEMFRFLYSLESRRSLRVTDRSTLFLISVVAEDSPFRQDEILARAKEKLKMILGNVLRKGDAYTFWNEQQAMALLSGLQSKDSVNVLKRIEKSFLVSMTDQPVKIQIKSKAVEKS